MFNKEPAAIAGFLDALLSVVVILVHISDPLKGALLVAISAFAALFTRSQVYSQGSVDNLTPTTLAAAQSDPAT